MAITWEVSCTELLRVLVNDLDEPYIYTDAKIKRVLVVAAYQVITEASFDYTFTVDISLQSISPDPTVSASLDENFVNLMCLKAACIMDKGKAIKAAGKAVSGRDMNAVQFDLRGVSDASLELLKFGYCHTYKEAINDYLYGSNAIGKVVMGPFRTYANTYYSKGPYYYN